MISIADQESEVVGLGRLELPTSPLSGVRSSQLSYRPGVVPVACASYGLLYCPQPLRVGT